MGVSLEGILGMQPLSLSLIAFPPWGAQLYSTGPCVARGHRQQSQKHWLRFLKIWSEKKHFFALSCEVQILSHKDGNGTRELKGCAFTVECSQLWGRSWGLPQVAFLTQGVSWAPQEKKHSLPKSAFSTVETYLLLGLFPSQSGKMQSSFCHDFAFNKMRNQKEALQCTISCVISLWFSSSRCA